MLGIYLCLCVCDYMCVQVHLCAWLAKADDVSIILKHLPLYVLRQVLSLMWSSLF